MFTELNIFISIVQNVYASKRMLYCKQSYANFFFCTQAIFRSDSTLLISIIVFRSQN